MVSFNHQLVYLRSWYRPKKTFHSLTHSSTKIFLWLCVYICVFLHSASFVPHCNIMFTVFCNTLFTIVIWYIMPRSYYTIPGEATSRTDQQVQGIIAKKDSSSGARTSGDCITNDVDTDNKLLLDLINSDLHRLPAVGEGAGPLQRRACTGQGVPCAAAVFTSSYRGSADFADRLNSRVVVINSFDLTSWRRFIGKLVKPCVSLCMEAVEDGKLLRVLRARTLFCVNIC